ncbi:MAG: hypothetical protein ACJAZO_002495 [Myxococcota bacterium]|jgi:hypothetical protein
MGVILWLAAEEAASPFPIREKGPSKAVDVRCAAPKYAGPEGVPRTSLPR